MNTPYLPAPLPRDFGFLHNGNLFEVVICPTADAIRKLMSCIHEAKPDLAIPQGSGSKRYVDRKCQLI